LKESKLTESNSTPIRVLLVDDHAFVRQCLRSLIEKQPDVEVIGEAEDGRIAVDLVRELLPDVVIMDVGMPNLNGVEATRLILSEFTQVKIVALSGHSDRLHVAGMLKAGASAYVLKDCASDELVEAIIAVARGETYLCPKVTRTVIGDYIGLLSEPRRHLLETLSVREREVLQLLTEGKPAKQIALELHVTAKAIEANRRKIMKKLDAHNIPKLVKLAISGGVTSLE
jgi:DNA-binding NarL/FixJ family response regulator